MSLVIPAFALGVLALLGGGGSSRTQSPAPRQPPRPPAPQTQQPPVPADTAELERARAAALALATYIRNRGTDTRIVADLQRKMGVVPASGKVGNITAARARALGIEFPSYSEIPAAIRAGRR